MHQEFRSHFLTSSPIYRLKFVTSKSPLFSLMIFLLLNFVIFRDDSNILACIPTTNIFIEAGLDHGGILVHCFGGKSRSPAFIAAYLMSSRNWSFDQAYSVIKTARPAVEINLGFECQLRAYYASNFDVYVAQQILLRTRIRDLHYLKESSSSPVKSTEMNVVTNPVDGSPSGGLPSDLPPIHEWIAQNILQNPNPKLGIHDSFTCAPRDENGNLIAGSVIVQANQQIQNRNKRALSEAKELPPLEAIPMVQADDDMEVVTDAEDSIASLRTPVPKSNTGSNHSNFTNFNGKSGFSSQNSSVISGIETFEESMDSAMTMMSTDPVNSRPGSSNSVRKPLSLMPAPLTVSTVSAPPTVSAQRGFGGPGLSLNMGPPQLTESQQSQLQFQPSLYGRSINLGSSSNGSITRRAKQARNRSSFSATQPIQSGALPQSTTPEIGTKNPSCHLSRPGCSWVRVIPPLRGLEREFKCSWCNTTLFQLANVIRIDLNVTEMLDKFYESLEKMSNHNSSTNSSGFGSNEDDVNKQFIMTHQQQLNNPLNQFPTNMMGELAVELISPRGASNTNMFKQNNLLPPIKSASSSANTRSTMNIFSSPTQEMEVDNSNNIHFSSSFKHTSSHNNSFGFSNNDELKDNYPMPLSTTRASQSKNKGFTFDMMEPAAPANHGSSSHGFGVGIAQQNPPMTPRNSGNPVGETVLTTPRRLPSLEVQNNLDSPRMQQPPIMKRQNSLTSNPQPSFPAPSSSSSSSLSNNNHTVFNPPTTSLTKVPILPANRKNTPGNTSLGPPYPNSLLAYDESPRLMIPPHRQQEILQQQGVINTSDYASLANTNNAMIYNNPMNRPKSAEKRRWLARVNLLSDNGQNNPNSNSSTMTKIMHLADADEIASQIALNGGKYYYIEYMDWMGKDIFKANCHTGNVICPGCKNTVGSWAWTPSQRLLLDGRLEAPLFRIHKHVVHHVSSFPPSFPLIWINCLYFFSSSSWIDGI